jgi:hypothetical protein
MDSTIAGNIWNVTFRNPDGSLVAVAVDNGGETGSKRFDLRVGGDKFSYQASTGEVATFTLPAPSER